MRYYRIYMTVLAGITAIFMLCFPFIMYLHVREPKGMELIYFAKKSRIMLEVFLYHKEMALLFFALFLIAALGFGLAAYWVVFERPPMGWKKDRYIFLALGTYFFLTAVSVMHSEYREYGLFGSGLDYEGLAAIFAYMILFTAGYVLFSGKQEADILRIVLRVLMLVLIMGTFLELACGPVMNIGWIQRIIIPEKYAHLMERWVLKGYQDISLTFSNPGFFGGFCGMLLPIGLGMAFTDLRKPTVVMDMLLGGGMFFCVIMSGSTGALYGAAGAAFLESLVLYRKRKRADRRGILIKSLGCLVFTGLLLAAAQTADRGKAEDGGIFLKELFGKVGKSVINEQYERNDDIFEMEKMTLEDGLLYIQGKDAMFTVEALADASEMTLDDFRFTDGDGNQLKPEMGTDWRNRLPGGAYELVEVSVNGRILSIDLGYQDPVSFYEKEGSLYYIDFNGSLLSAIPQPVLPQLKLLYPLFTGRGYFWISSLPILKETLVLGKGIGAFPFVYEQSEVVGMLNVHGSAEYCVEQAHSWYLQTVVSSGVIALLCMLYVFIRILKKGIKKQLRMEYCTLHWTDFLVWGLLAYMVTGIVNNSCVAATPMFWFMLGVQSRGVRE